MTGMSSWEMMTLDTDVDREPIELYMTTAIPLLKSSAFEPPLYSNKQVLSSNQHSGCTNDSVKKTWMRHDANADLSHQSLQVAE
jgi:hypothetical protein